MLLGLGPHLLRGLVIAAIGVFFAIVGIHPALRNMADPEGESPLTRSDRIICVVFAILLLLVSTREFILSW